MTVKNLIRILKDYNQDAEVRVATDLKNGSRETVGASTVDALHEVNRAHLFGFAQVMLKKKSKKSSKKIIIY